MNAKKLLTNKWVWIAGGGVLGLGYLLLRGSSGGGEDIPYADSMPDSVGAGGSGGSSGGSSPDMSGYVTGSEFMDTIGALSGAYAKQISSMQTDFQNQLTSLAIDNQDLQNDLNAATGRGYVGYSLEGDELVAQLTLDVPVGVGDPIMLGGSSSRYYGEGGIDYNKASASEKKSLIDRQKRLETDAGFLQSEIDRAARAVKDRKDDGIDYSAQQKELDKLKKMVGSTKKAG